MQYSKDELTRHKKSQVILAVFLTGLLAAAALLMLLVYQNLEKDINSPIAQPIVQETVDPSVQVDIEDQVVKKPQFNAALLQTTLDAWISQSGGTAGVVVMDIEGSVLAANGQNRSFFAASIYKLFVAYEGYRLVDSGSRSLNEQFLNNQTLGDCLDLMVQESDSPCAEKLWAELGRAELTQTLKSYGISDTDMVGLRTTSYDVAKILMRIASGEELSNESQQKLLVSMSEQVYRDALDKGFSDNVTVYNKIGFNEQVEYHDTAIIELSDGRKLIISVLTENIGTRKIAALGVAIEAALE